MKNKIHTAFLRSLALTVVLFASLTIPMSVVAQESAFGLAELPLAQLPAGVDGLSIVDGGLHCHSAGVLLMADRSNGTIVGFWADTTVARLKDGVNYVVRQPGTGHYYFTVMDEGESQLYVFKPDEGRHGRTSRVKLGNMSVEHPCFTADGDIMVFASRRGRRGYGGADLWYSTFRNERWSRPQNVGNRVNTQYDELAPSMYGDYLLFASNGQDDDHSALNIYATRLLSDNTDSDTVGMLQIGRNRIQRLPEPFNSASTDDYDMVVDTVYGCGYWITKPLDDNAPARLRSFSGDIRGVTLWGRVTDRQGKPVGSTEVKATQGDRVACSAITDEAGFYRLYLRRGESYTLTYRHEGYFVGNEKWEMESGEGDMMYVEGRRDMAMDRLQLGERLVYEDLFNPGVDLEMSRRGMDILEPLVRFLDGNPTMSVSFTLYSDATDDPSFNRLLTAHRLTVLADYLCDRLPQSVAATFQNGCEGQEGCSSATGLSRLVVIILDK